MCDVSSCATLTVCHNRPLLRSWCVYIFLQLTLNVIQQASLVADQAKCVDIHFCCDANHFPDCAEGSEEKNVNITGKTVSAVLCESGIVECLKGWRCVVGLEECGGRAGGVWDGWRCVVGLEVYGTGGGVWEGWRCIHGERGGVVGVWEGCGGVWWEAWMWVVGG